MQVSHGGAESISNSAEEDVWRRRLIDRLADVQVALWASEADPGQDQHLIAGAVIKPSTSAVTPPELLAEPDTVFLGLTGRAPHHAPQGPGSTSGNAYATWDRIDEKRQLSRLARQFATEATIRARRGGLIFNICIVAAVCAVGFGSISFITNGSLLSNAMWADAPLSAGESNAITATGPSTFPINAPRQANEHYSHSANAGTAVRNPAADQIVAILSETRHVDVVEERFREFVELKRLTSLLPVVRLQVSESGMTSFPLKLQSSAADAADVAHAIVLLSGLPSSVVPLKGSGLVDGIWQFELADLPHQGFRIEAAAVEPFELNFGVIQPNGTMIDQGRSQIELHRHAPDQSLRSASTVGSTTYSGGASPKPTVEAARSRGSKPVRSRTEIAAGGELQVTKAAPRKSGPASRSQAEGRPMALGGDPDTERPARRSQSDEGAVGGQSSWSFKPQAHPSWSPFGADRSR